MFTIRQARMLSGKTQEDMAKTLKISVSTYRRIEKSPESATIQFARNFSRAANLTVDDIFFSRNSTLSRYGKERLKLA